MLRVIQPFGDHQVGDEITDATEIEEIVGSDHVHFVVRVAVPEPEAQTPAIAAPAETEE